MPVAENKSPERAQKLQRIEARIRPDQKSRIERAASIRGTSVSDFIVQHAERAALKTIEEHEAWVLTGADREVFVEALLNPGVPSPRLRAAAKRYKQRIQK
jgi:uncharacterized protein (DUF1778 family)